MSRTPSPRPLAARDPRWAAVGLAGGLLAGLGVLVGGTMPGPAWAQEAGSLRQVARSCGAAALVEAGPRETVEVVFPDGASVVLAPGAAAELGCDAEGGVAVTLRGGLVRVASGLAGAGRPVRIATPQARLVLEGGAAVVAVEDGRTRAHLVGVGELAVAAGGRERVVYRPGFEVVVAGGAPSRPRRLTAAEAAADLRRLNPGLATGLPPRLTGAADDAGGGAGADVSGTVATGEPAAGEGAAAAGVPGAFEAAEIDPAEFARMGPGEPNPDPDPEPNPGPGPDPDPEPDTPSLPDFDSGLGGLELAGGFEPTVGKASDVTVEGNTSASAGNRLVRLQESSTDSLDMRGLLQGNFPDAFDNVPGVNRRTFGPTANTVHAGPRLTQMLADGEDLAAVAGEGGLAYFQGTSVFGLRDADVYSDEQDGIFLFSNFGASRVPKLDGVFSANSIFGAGGGLLSAATGLGLIPFDPEEEPGVGVGAFAEGLTFGGITARDTPDLERGTDNFFFLSITPAIAYRFTGERYEAALSESRCSSLECPSPGEYYEGIVQSNVLRLHKDAGIPLAPGSDLNSLYEVDGFGLERGPGESIAPGDIVALLRDPTERRRILFAAGDLDGLVGAEPPGPVVDRFHLSAGMAGAVLGGVDGDLAPGMDAGSGAGRAFLRDETWTGLDRRPEGERFDLAPGDMIDAGLFVINPAGRVLPRLGPSGEVVEPGRTAKVLHADFALRGEGPAQVSTISATIGEVAFRFSALPGQAGPPTEADAFLSARTVGSSRGLTKEGETEASTLVSGGVLSTAAGGGNPNLAGDGRLGFLVLENAGEVFVDGGNEGFVDGRIEAVFAGEAEPGVLPGGRERPVGENPEAPDLRFAAARLGVATADSGQRLSAFPRSGLGDGLLLGYAAALVEVEGVDGDGRPAVGLARLPVDGSNLRFSGLDPARNEIAATLRVGGEEIALGGGEGRSAFLSDELFGLRTAAPEEEGAPDLAMVSGGLVLGGLERDELKDLEEAGLRAPPEYEHLKWGFFFGDLGAAPEGGRRHAHLGSFVAGERLSAAQGLSVTNPVVTYSGHAAGNVRDGQNVYTAIGTYRDEFDFGSRSGQITMDFDGRRLTGPSRSTQDLQRYGGTLADGGGFSGSVSGRFAGPLVGAGDARSPAGVLGAFGIQNDTDNPNAAYRASGTFAAEQ